MSKKLSEMSLEELWQLFPIILTEHQDCWTDWFDEEKNILQSLLPKTARINHIGSTTLAIWAKPIIDILVEVPGEYDLSDVKNILVNHGYICMSQSDNRISFNKGYTEDGFAERVFHLHVRFIGDNDELYFRDYLSEYPDIACQYEKMKINLGIKYKHNRDNYTNAKTDFVKKYTGKARQIYGDRY